MKLMRRRAARAVPVEGTTGAEPARPAPQTGEEEGRGETSRAGGARTREPVAATERRAGPERRTEPARPAGGFGARTRDAGAAAVGTIGSGVLMVARLVVTVAVLIALLIALAIVLRDVDANQSNTIAKGIHEGANFFAGSFTGLISFSGHPKRAITVDWGIALIVYLIVGAVLASVIARIGRRGVGFERRHRVVPTA
jgi:hypothetical protein